MEGLVGTGFLLFLFGLLPCAQRLWIGGYKESRCQSNIADSEYNSCLAKQDMVKMDSAIELNSEEPISYVSKDAVLFFFFCMEYNIEDTFSLDVFGM